MMNSLLHDMQGELKQGDTLSALGESMKGYDLVLTHPPIGTKNGGGPPGATLLLSCGFPHGSSIPRE